MKNNWIASFLAIAASIGFAQSASAQVTTLYSTNFNAPTYVDGVLNSGADLVTPGQDGWLTTSGGATNAITVSNTATNGIVSLTTSGQDVRRLFNGGAAVTAGSVFFDADVTVSAAQATGDYALHMSDGSTTNFYARTYFRSAGGALQMSLGTSSGAPTVYGADLNFGQSYHVLVRYDINPGLANDSGALYINPTTVDGSGDTPYILALNTGIDATSISALALRQGTAANAATLTVDNFRGFTPIPEPTSMALCGLAAAGGVVRFWRRKKVQPEV